MGAALIRGQLLDLFLDGLLGGWGACAAQVGEAVAAVGGVESVHHLWLCCEGVCVQMSVMMCVGFSAFDAQSSIAEKICGFNRS